MNIKPLIRFGDMAANFNFNFHAHLWMYGNYLTNQKQQEFRGAWPKVKHAYEVPQWMQQIWDQTQHSHEKTSPARISH